MDRVAPGLFAEMGSGSGSGRGSEDGELSTPVSNSVGVTIVGEPIREGMARLSNNSSTASDCFRFPCCEEDPSVSCCSGRPRA